ncbi:hypothetical protein JCM16303_006108 [Sporobolomyces ruberrimus]
MPPAYLTPSQRETLAQFESITARNDERSSLEALEATGWNLEAAISRVFDGGSSSRTSYPPTSSTSSYREEASTATVDEALLPSSSATPSNGSFDAASPRRRTNGMGTGIVGIHYLRQALAVPLHILSWPLSIVYNLGTLVLGFLARLLGFRLSTSTFHPRNPFASSPRGGGAFNSSRSRRPRTILSPSAAAQEWVDSVQRLLTLPTSPTTSSTGVEIGTSAGLTRRNVDGTSGEETELPEFFVGGYEQALRKARDELRLLMVILTCEEHDEDEAFKRRVLTDPELIKSLKDEKVIVWGGDVTERDAYQVGRTLSYTALPFIAFIALQPTTSTPSASSSSSPRLSLISRLEPSSSSLPTLSASHIHTHLHSVVLPKSTPYLSRLLADKQRRESERFHREERERRASQVAKRDEERILGIRKAKEIQRREEIQRQERLEREREEFERRRRRGLMARRWREEKRNEFERKGESQEGIRLVVRLGNGKRVMRRFEKEEPVKEVYEWVECELGREEDAQQEEEEEEHIDAGEFGEYRQKFAFRLATTFPRQLIELPSSLFEGPASGSSGRPSFDSLDEVENGGSEGNVLSVGEAFAGMGKDVNLVVDGLEERRRLSMSSRGDDDDDEEEDEDDEGEE